ncbi:cytochrome P450 [Micromonospora sonneratiae]|uniref:Cytochrome P450 n=1 Tax=Micromonospora sonneratiae TaxID=1184706 RepID=A0ABW3YLG0_9ACTN
MVLRDIDDDIDIDDPIRSLVRPDILPDPYPTYTRLRDRQPIFFYEPLQSWMLTRYADCVAVLRDSERFAADWRRAGEEMPPQAISVQTLDPPEHTAIRRLVMEALRVVDHDAITRKVADRVSQLLASAANRPSVDFIAEVAEPLTAGTIADFLGVPQPELSWFVAVSKTVADGMDAGLWPELGPPAMSARAELAAFTDSWLVDPPASGVVAHIAVHIDRSGVERTVVANTLRVLLHAGFESASRLCGLAAAVLLGEPHRLDLFRRADPHLAVDELVRFTSPVQATARVCVTDTELDGVRISAGQAVTLLLGAANRDPDRFPQPDSWWPERRVNPHLGFGRGAHSCLGSPFAALQARALFSALAAEHPAARLVADPVFRPNLTLRGLDRLDIALR